MNNYKNESSPLSRVDARSRPGKTFVSLIALITLFPALTLAAPTRFTSPNYAVESVIVGGTGTLRSSEASIPPAITSGPEVSSITISSASISWQTDKASNEIVRFGTSAGVYTDQAGQVTDTTSTSHTVPLAKLNRATTYYYKVRSSDISGNMVESAEASFITELGDIQPPIVSKGPSIANNSATSLTVTWVTNELSNTVVEYGMTAVTENSTGNTEEQTSFHQVVLMGLQSSQAYFLRVKSRDASGNSIASPIQVVTTLNAPTVTEVTISDITLNSALVQWRTTLPSSTALQYGPNSSYGQSNNDPTFTQAHVARLTGLQSGTAYYVKIAGQDEGGNGLSSDEYIFKTVILPTISDFKVKVLDSDSAEFSWKSSSDIDELIRYQILENSEPSLIGKQGTAGNEKLVSDHIFKVADLEPGSKYSVTVLGKDVFGNQATSQTLEFTTGQDNTPPAIENIKTDTSVDLGSRQTVQVLVSFGLSELGTAQIEYGRGATGAYDNKINTDTEITRNKFMVIPQLQPGESYHFRIVAKDRVGNTFTSADYLVLAPAQPVSLLDLIFGRVRDNFGWLENL